jgi:diguanylate cyclase (GGDEF)-like protein/PAS domain S-box-containing protein
MVDPLTTRQGIDRMPPARPDEKEISARNSRPGKRWLKAGEVAMLSNILETGEQFQPRKSTLRGGEATFRKLVEALGSAVFVFAEDKLIYVNHAAEVITQYSKEELLTMSFGDLVCPDSRKLVARPRGMGQEADASPPQVELRILTKNSEERWLEVSEVDIYLDGAPASLITAFDITEYRRSEEEAQLMAITDPLTGLGNYRQILNILNSEIERSGRTGRSFALLLLDMDGLKQINDRYGHLVGNRALCRLADVLRGCCRVIDTVGRYGGDEFCVILPETSAEAAESVASRICKELAKDIHPAPLSVSLGVVAYPQDAETVEDLLRAADRRLYCMKRLGPEKACMFSAA